MRVRIKSLAKCPSKCQSNWSSFKYFLSVTNVVVTLKELYIGRKYVTHHDSLSNCRLSGKEFAPSNQEVDANFQENKQDPEESNLPVINPNEALMRTRFNRVVKLTSNQDFNYSFMLPCSIFLSPSMSSSFEEHLHSVSLSTCSLEAHLQSLSLNITTSPCATSSVLFCANSSDYCIHFFVISLCVCLSDKTHVFDANSAHESSCSANSPTG